MQGKNHRIVATPVCILTISNHLHFLLDPFDCNIIDRTSLLPRMNRISCNIPVHSEVHTSLTGMVILGFLSCVPLFLAFHRKIWQAKHRIRKRVLYKVPLVNIVPMFICIHVPIAILTLLEMVYCTYFIFCRRTIYNMLYIMSFYTINWSLPGVMIQICTTRFLDNVALWCRTHKRIVITKLHDQWT